MPPHRAHQVRECGEWPLLVAARGCRRHGRCRGPSDAPSVEAKPAESARAVFPTRGTASWEIVQVTGGILSESRVRALALEVRRSERFWLSNRLDEPRRSGLAHRVGRPP